MKKRVRYAVVGLGQSTQTAMLPAFVHAENSELTALVSGDPIKLKKLGKKYAVKDLYSYESFSTLVRSGKVDAIYIATPGLLHRQFAEYAAYHGVHILCAKPTATTVKSCRSLIHAAEEGGVKLMLAYRLISDDCIGAARGIFGDEPLEVLPLGSWDQCLSTVMRFPGDRMVSFSMNSDKHDQCAAELVYFSKCILERKDPEPCGKVGITDVRLINALMMSAASSYALRS